MNLESGTRMGIKYLLAALLSLVSVAIVFLGTKNIPHYYRIIEILPLLGYIPVFWLLEQTVVAKFRVLGLWVLALALPWFYASLTLSLIAVYYSSIPHPYQSWDIALTYLWVFHMAILYVYSVLQATYTTYRISKIASDFDTLKP